MRVCVIVKNETALRRETRPVGFFSYPVPEVGLDWDFRVVGKRFVVDTQELVNKGYDAIVHEDFGTAGTYKGGHLPLIYLDIDSTLGDLYHDTRLPIAAQAALILVDQAPLDPFAHFGVPVYRFPYCVNDHVLASPDTMRAISNEHRDIDVCLHHNKGTFERQLISASFPDLCRSLGLTSTQGSIGYPEFAANIGRAKVVLNWPRVPTNRPHRVFDAMAAGAALLTGPLPSVDGDLRRVGYHYRTFRFWSELVDQLRALIAGNEWEAVARNGHTLVMAHHTWAIRARQFRTILETHGLWK